MSEKKALITMVVLALLCLSSESLANLGRWAPVDEQVAEAFAKVEVPSFANQNPDSVAREFGELFDGFSLKQEVFEKLQREVTRISEGKVSVERGAPNDFKSGVRGAAEYLILIRGGERRRVIMAPAFPPVWLDTN